MSKIDELRLGFETAYIDGSVVSSNIYRPQFVSNNHKEGKKVLSSIEDELLVCDGFQISVAFITMNGITPLLQTLKELEKRNIKGEILTTNYLNFSEPKALKKLNELSNITLKMYDVEVANEGFHTKGYIFRKEEIYHIIIGSSNITSAALTDNREWNTKLVSTVHGETAKEIVTEFNELWNSNYALTFDEFYENYNEHYKIIKHQREVAKQEEITSIEKYKLQPNSMQIGFIINLKKILEAGEDRALLISATGTGKTYASAFAMRELGFKRVLFLVHRGQLARQTKKSYEKVFAESVSMGLVGAGYHEYDADYIFATVQTLNRDEHLLQYEKDAFDCIVLDEAHHVPADTYQKVMNHFTPKLWLGMTATPDKRDDNMEGRNVYELFNYQIAYEIRLQQAMEEKLLCPFHYFGITDLAIIGDNGDTSRDFSMLTSEERVKHIINQADYYGYSGDKVKGLIFCSNIKETEELSAKFNEMINPSTGKKYRTIALNGSASEQESNNSKVVVGNSETVKPVSMTMVKKLLGDVFEEFVKEDTSYKMTDPCKRLFAMIFLGNYTEGSLDETIKAITADEKIQRTLKKKLKGKYEKDTETLIKLAGLPEQEASDWAYLTAEIINWEWILQILKAAEWKGTPQEAIEIIRAAVIVDEGIKVTVEAEKGK